jgi:hypothetical protein
MPDLIRHPQWRADLLHDVGSDLSVFPLNAQVDAGSSPTTVRNNFSLE